MKNSNMSFPFSRTVLALAVCAACLPAQAQISEASVYVGAGLVGAATNEASSFGQYTGVRADRSTVGSLGGSYSLRDEDNGRWIEFLGADLLGNNRSLGLVVKNPGTWKLGVDYSELIRYDTNVLNTGMQRIGEWNPQIVRLAGGAGSGSDVQLSTKRTGLGLSYTNIINPSAQFTFDFKSERKEGARLSSIGMSCVSAIAPSCGGNPLTSSNWAVLMLPEPINASHNQFEAGVSYALDAFRVHVGYYGSFYRNGNQIVAADVPGSLNNPLGSALSLANGLQGLLSEPLALAPDNQAHQLDVSGSYDFAKGTRGTFKVGYSIASQTADYTGSVLSGAPTGVTDLGGQVAVKSARLGLSSRITPVLSVLADARYEDKDDRTAIAMYNTDGVRTYSNRDLPNRKITGKLQAQWQLTGSSKASLGTNYESIDRGVFTSTAYVGGISALRQNTNENTLFADVRRQLSDEFSGSVAISQSQRTGSNWLQPNRGTGVTAVADSAAALGSTALYMPNLADRQRNKVRLFTDWLMTENASLQISAEEGRDYFNAPSAYGLQSSRFNQLGLDLSYALATDWNVSTSLALGSQTSLQARPAGYVLAFEDKSYTASVGVTGKASAKLDVGANWAYVADLNAYNQRLDVNASAGDAKLLASGFGLPDTQFSQQTVRLFGRYALEKSSSVRLDFVHQTVQNNDWAWMLNGVPFVFSDGSTVAQKATQNVNYLGATYTYMLP